MAVVRNKAGSLTELEKRAVKGLLARKWRNQDIQALLNIGRAATVNSARITEVKQDESIKRLEDDELDYFLTEKNAFDPATGLNHVRDERLIRAREAMVLAVTVFNNPSVYFKTEVFSVLANIAWTYLLHEYYLRKGVKVFDKDGTALYLSQMIKRHDCPLSQGMKDNLNSLKEIRDAVEHSLFGKGDLLWQGIYQACCLNFEKMITELYGPQLSLQGTLSFALQFARMNIDQLATVQKYDIPEHISVLDANLDLHLSKEQKDDLEYQFKVVYTLDSASKRSAHIQFLNPDSAEGKEVRNILVKHKPADELYPYKPKQVCQLVRDQTGKAFNIYNHTQAWHMYKVRPKCGAKKPENTNKTLCIYHAAHGDYTYSDDWVSLLVEALNNPEEEKKIKEFAL